MSILTWPFKFLQKHKSSLSKDEAAASLYNVAFPDLIDGEKFDPAVLKGKVVILSNTASKCGLTDNHYQEFNELYEKYNSTGLEILGFPCAQFNNQEHQDVCSIKDRAKGAKVAWPLFERIEVNGPGTHKLFQWLKHQSGSFGSLEGQTNIGWNFGKFLVDREGKVIGYFGPKTKPLRMEEAIKKALGV